MDITDIILEEHNKQRRLFGYIQEIDRGDTEALNSVWKYVQRFLDVHAAAEERYFYPELLKQGSGAADANSASDETRDAIKDHNEIRDTGKAVDKEEVGSEAWFKAVAKCDLANSKHMSEEERQALADFRCSASLEERHRLGVKFLSYIAQHPSGVPPVDKDPDSYVKDPKREMESAGADA